MKTMKDSSHNQKSFSEVQEREGSKVVEHNQTDQVEEEIERRVYVGGNKMVKVSTLFITFH